MITPQQGQSSRRPIQHLRELLEVRIFVDTINKETIPTCVAIEPIVNHSLWMILYCYMSSVT